VAKAALLSVRGIKMRLSAIAIALLVPLALTAAPAPQTGMPMMHTVVPDSGKAGEVVEIQGEHLGQESVAAVYLTDGKKDTKLQILEQTETSIKFKIPSETMPGSFALMVLTRDKPPKLIEEPVRITVVPETTGSSMAAAIQNTRIAVHGSARTE